MEPPSPVNAELAPGTAPVFPPGDAARATTAAENVGQPHWHTQTHEDTADAATTVSNLEAAGQRFPSRVAVDFFDPEGVDELRRTLTAQSQRDVSAHSVGGQRAYARKSGDENTVVSETDVPGQDKFDVEQFLESFEMAAEVDGASEYDMAYQLRFFI